MSLQTVGMMVDKARYGEVKGATGGTINSTGIPPINTDCYSRLCYISGFREKTETQGKRITGGGYKLEGAIRPFRESVPLKYLSKWRKRDRNRAEKIG